MDAHMEPDKVRAIAFYLPQFHPVPENDEWWGKGFTEWRNVAKAKPLFPGHYQPHVPADLGFYDLRCAETREDQARLAREYGIHGFCYYHYWFNGRRILERPFNEVLASGKPDFPFCLCWANENWTRVWDGGDKHVLLEQHYNEEDDLTHIQSLIPAFRDERYIRINGRPLFLVYRAGFIPDSVRTTKIWREAAEAAGLDGLYLVRVLEYETFDQKISPQSMGFDAEVEFSPFSWPIGGAKFRDLFSRIVAKAGLLSKCFLEDTVIDYATMANGMSHTPVPAWTRFHSVTPAWDNSARRKTGAMIFNGSTPVKYEEWLRNVVMKTEQKYRGDECILFINAWNEWAEGNHLEPDLKWGHAYLEATKLALTVRKSVHMLTGNEPRHLYDESNRKPFQQLYWRINKLVKDKIDLLRYLGRPG